jgi:hypothetical protein
MGIGSLIFSFNAPKVLSIQDAKIGLIHRSWQVLVAVAIILLCTQEEPWRKKGTGRHFFFVRPELPSAESLSSLGASSRLLSVQDNVFFVALNYTYHQESRCDTVAGWCAVDENESTTLTTEASKKIKLSVSSRFEPDEEVFEWSTTQIKLFTHDGGFDMSMNEVFSKLAKDQGMTVDEWIATAARQGTEAQLTYDWRCEDSSELAQSGCEVKVELGQISSSHGFEVTGASQPVATKNAAGSIETVRRRSHVTGLTVHMRGEGGIEATSTTTVLGIVAQVVIFLLLGNQIVTMLSNSFLQGAPRRKLVCEEQYNDEVHQQIDEIVEQKKDAQPELIGLSDATLHAKLVDDIETLCGFELHGKAKDKEKLNKVLKVLTQTSGSVHKAAKMLGDEGSALRLQMIQEANKKAGDKFSKDEPTNVN